MAAASPVSLSGPQRWVVISILALTALAYLPVYQAEFMEFDDSAYVSDNPAVQQGFTPTTIAWAFTTGHAANWHPLTWLSHMLDWRLWGPQAGGHHASSVGLHLLGTLAAFCAMRRLTHAPWPSIAVAAVFALHPIHVESVAWIAERKDVLCGLFWWLTVWAYALYAEAPSRMRYLVVLLTLTLALCSKPMAVTLPCVLLLLDRWPLKRRALLEKLPMMLLVISTCVVTVLAQAAGSAVRSVERYSLIQRATNAIWSYAMYLRDTAWPSGLAAYYPYPLDSYPALGTIAILTLLVAVTSLAWSHGSSKPYLLTGWLWYLGTLVPVIGLVQVGDQARADRYLYLPMSGVVIAVAWWLAERFPRPRVVTPIAAGLALSFALLTYRQAATWRNGITLFEQALRVTENNHLAHNNLAIALAARGRTEEAIDHYRRALEINGKSVYVHTNLGNALSVLDQRDQARQHYLAALALDPSYVGAHYNLGLLEAKEGNLLAAVDHYQRALAAAPQDVRVRNNLGITFAKLGRLDEAIAQFEAAIRVRSNHAVAWANLAQARYMQQDWAQAREALQRAEQLGYRVSPELKRAIESGSKE
jgi:tetratricopeptide (TPR) repeat protein